MFFSGWREWAKFQSTRLQFIIRPRIKCACFSHLLLTANILQKMYVQLSCLLGTRPPNIHGFYNTILICDWVWVFNPFRVSGRFRESGFRFCFCCCCFCFCCGGSYCFLDFPHHIPKCRMFCTKHFWAGCANIFCVICVFFALQEMDIVVWGTPFSVRTVFWNVEFFVCFK